MAQAPSKRLFFKLAEGYLETGRIAESLAMAEQGLRAHPGYLSCLEIKGFALVRLGRWAEAVAVLDDVNRRVGGDKVKTFLAMGLFGAGRKEQAESLCREILAANPFNAEIKRLLNQGGQPLPAAEPLLQPSQSGVEEEAVEIIVEEEPEPAASPVVTEPQKGEQQLPLGPLVSAAIEPPIAEKYQAPFTPPEAPAVAATAKKATPETPKKPRKSRFGRSLFRLRKSRKDAETENEAPTEPAVSLNGEVVIEEPEEIIDAFSDPLQDDQKDTAPAVAEKTLVRGAVSTASKEETIVRQKGTESPDRRKEKAADKPAPTTKKTTARQYDPTEGMEAELSVEDIDVFSELEEDEKS